MKVIDLHNHLFPPAWIDYLEDRPGSPTLKRTGPGSMIFYYADRPLSHVHKAGHYDVDARLEDMDRYAIDTQILSLTTPSVEFLPAGEGETWAKKVNDTFADICRTHKGRFHAFATLPFQQPEACVKELERAYKDLGVKGVTIFSNIVGKPIYTPEFYPIYEMAEAYGLPLFIHPAPPITTEVLKRVGMPTSLYGFIFDTTMAVSGLIFSGVLERFPKLKLIHAHLGGVFPYMVGRIDATFTDGIAVEWGYSLPELPSVYYQRQVYVDCVSFHLPAVRCAIEFLGIDHILLGTDYPHPLGGAEKAIKSINDLQLSQEDREKIFSGNAISLLGLDR
jgi:aminocarboxymuconate-semialdehyde decarboxylase